MLVAGLLAAMPALAGARLLPEADQLAADAARLDRTLLSLDGGVERMPVALGVTSLLTAAASVTVGMAMVGAGQLQFFLPLVVLVPTISTVLGTVLIITGAVRGEGASVEEVVALARERDELLARRAALLRAKEAEAPAPEACGDAAQPAGGEVASDARPK